jgi:tetratricopeptide (TPR) repeat protein
MMPHHPSECCAGGQARVRAFRLRPLGNMVLSAVLAAAPALLAQKASSPDAARLQNAQTLLQRGQLAEAKAEIVAELQRHPASVEACNLLGIVEAEQQNFESAVADFQKALRIAPGSAKTHNNLGTVYLAEKKLDLAEKEFRSSVRLDPQNRDGNYNLGVLLMERGSAAEAIPYLDRVRPADRETRLALIQANFAAQHTAQALRIADEISAGYPGDFKLHFSLGIVLASAHQYKRSELEFEKADTLQPPRFEVLFNLGQACLLSGDYGKAELQATRALAVQHDSPDALFLLGQAEWKQSRPLDALDVLVRARRADPKNPDIILLMAQISMAQGYYADSIPLLESGLAIAPQRTDLRLALGESYLRADQTGKAVAEFEKVLAAKPSTRAYALLGLAETYLGRFEAAKEAFRHGLTLEPHNLFCLFNLGYIAERQGQGPRAAAVFEQVLRADPQFPGALLELAALRIEANRYPEAEELLNRYVQLNRNPAPGYYKLALVERKLNKTAAAERALSEFQKLSSNAATTYVYENLFDYLDNRSKLSAPARQQQDLTELQAEVKKRPDQPEVLYMLAEAYLRGGDAEDARAAIAHLDEVRAGDYRTLAGAGVLLARYHRYDEAIQQFQAALQANPQSNEARFDLANALFRKGRYAQALEAAQQVSEQERSDDAYLGLVADICAHLGEIDRAEEMDRSAIGRNPDNDQNYLALALLELRKNQIAEARRTLLTGQSRVPASGRILWGLGLVSVMQGDSANAAKQLEQAVDLLPEWPGSYSMLGIYYYQTGQIAKAREVLDRFKNSRSGGLDISRIEQVLASAPQAGAADNAPMSVEKREQLLQMAMLLVDRTL